MYDKFELVSVNCTVNFRFNYSLTAGKHRSAYFTGWVPSALNLKTQG